MQWELKMVMNSKTVTPKWFRHEALHSSNMLFENVNDHLLEHHYYHSKINPKYNEHIDKAIDHLWQAYQACNKSNEVFDQMPNPFYIEPKGVLVTTKKIFNKIKDIFK